MQASRFGIARVQSGFFPAGRFQGGPVKAPNGCAWLQAGKAHRAAQAVSGMRAAGSAFCAGPEIFLRREAPGTFRLELRAAWGELRVEFIRTPSGLRVELSGNEPHRLQAVFTLLARRFRTRLVRFADSPSGRR